MNRVVAALRGASALLTSINKNHAVVDGLAVSARSEPRFTRDVDLAIAVQSDTEAEQVVGVFLGHGYRLLAVVEQEATGRLATARLVPPGGDEVGIVVDLLFSSSGIEPEVCAQADAIPLLVDTEIPVARLGHLLALKVLSRDDQRRPQDRVDLAALLENAAPPEIQLARDSLQLITERGYHRGRDLDQDFAELLDASAPQS